MLDAATTTALASTTPSDHLGCYCNSPRTGWIVATTHPQAEPWAETNLQHRGYRTYLPRHAVRRCDRTIPTLSRVVIVPLWPGYIFVRHDSRDSWRPIYETPGVRSLIRNRDQIQWANADAVEAVEAGEQLRRSLPAPSTQWAPGALCSLRRGYAFEGLPAVVTAVSHNTAKVAVMFLGHLREVAVDIQCLVARDDA